MRAMAPRPTYEYQNREPSVTHIQKTPILQINDVYSIEVKICLKRHVGEDGSVATGVRGASREIGTWAWSGWRWASRGGEVEGGFSESLPSADAFAAQDYTREWKQEGKKGKEGEWVARALRLTRIVVAQSITGSRGAQYHQHVW